MTCLIIGRCAAASENFNMLVYVREAIVFSDREREFSYHEGRHSFTVEVGFSYVSTFLPFILELNGFSLGEIPQYTNENDNDDGSDDKDV
ncbi:hypothetical protein ALC62_11628 [Cyphomyrmex costatus]|uniref:Uncharacterized protein n=1 Tax=Cyphomyrmex costatus TaxID=456900 RepID=A0A151IC69_9HYME|nr:hypothetical protein ALC62_11628 [Cyphomyrmex costatus]